MAFKKITDLTAASAANDTDVFEKVNDPSGTPASQQVSLLQIATRLATSLAATFLTKANNLSDVANAATARTNLGAQASLGFTPLNPANNLSDVANTATARSNLGVTAVTFFAGAQTAFSATTLFTFAHGLGAIPKNFHCVMVNQSTDLGYTAGMEVDIRCVFHTSSGTEWSSVYADATNVYVAFREGAPAAANIRLEQAAGGVAVTGPDVTKWKFKVYALA